jgi:hypothetical protein
MHRYLFAALLLIPAAAFAQESNLQQRSGNYLVTLRPPAEGLFAAEEMEIELHLADASKDDPLTGNPPVVRAKIQSRIDMPSMPGMPVLTETAHPEGIPGVYGLHPVFAHGGKFRLQLQIAPPAGEPFQIEYMLDVADARPNRPKAASPYRITHSRKGKGLELRIQDSAGNPVTDFEIVHEMPMHLIIVNRDLSQFAHVHPSLERDGSFRLDRIPMSGDLRFFADFAPKGKGSQVLSFALKQSGKDAAPPDNPLVPARLEPASGQWRKGRTQEVLLSGGAPVEQLEPYLGAMAHLVMIHEDAETYVHAHPIEDTGKIIFLARPPKSGKYRAWVETKSKGTVHRQSFSVEVPE